MLVLYAATLASGRLLQPSTIEMAAPLLLSRKAVSFGTVVGTGCYCSCQHVRDYFILFPLVGNLFSKIHVLQVFRASPVVSGVCCRVVFGDRDSVRMNTQFFSVSIVARQAK